MNPPPDFVYALQIGHSGSVKIGVTTNLTRRLKDLQQACPELLHVLAHTQAERGVETDLHRRLHDAWLRGEWFRPEPCVLEAATFLATTEYVTRVALIGIGQEPVGAIPGRVTGHPSSWRWTSKRAEGA